ncbi:MAG: pyrimidine 5'-nucleotidase, partial [Anaerolineales bacterium]|nr:pyrimidine 5'-nucleotidase [Anaerolineales bacterium]
MRFTTFFFDLDETLYPSSLGLWQEIRARINAYMHERLGFSWEQIEILRDQYFREYGTTLRGLQANHQVDMDDYLAFVHDVPLEQYLRPNPALRAALEAIPVRKLIFTNADCAHAKRVIRALGLEGVFDGCIDVHVIAPYCKPMPEAFEKALVAAGCPDPRTCVLLDDQARITRAARALGMYTVLVGQADPGSDADEALLDITEL